MMCLRQRSPQIRAIAIGMLSRPFTRRMFDSGQLLRARPSQEVDRLPAAATVNSRAGVQQFGRRRRAFDRAFSPLWSPPMRIEGEAAPCATGARSNDGHDTRALQHYLGHKNIQHTVRYTEMAPDRFKEFWRN